MKLQIKKTKIEAILSIFFFVTIFNINSQNKNNWYFIGETGFNQVNNNTKLNLALGTEYYISNSSSLTLKLKYFKTGVDYFQKGTSCGFASFFCFSSKKLLYEGTILKIPINYKWETNFITNNLKFYLSTGVNLDFTLHEKIIEVKNITIDKNKANLNLNFGIGVIYKVSTNIDTYIYGDLYSGSPKSKEKIGFIFESKIRTQESSINIGLRYKL